VRAQGGQLWLHGTLLVGHVVAVFVGFGSILVTAVHAHLARADPTAEPIRAYFRLGPNVASWAIFAVPILGLAVAVVGRVDRVLAQPWLVGASVCWGAAAALAVGAIWPGEARIQAMVAETPSSGDATAHIRQLVSASRRVEFAGAAANLLAAGAFVAMVVKPGAT